MSANLIANAVRADFVYDAVGNVVEVRSPRYFDLNDANGYQQARTTSTYTGRNLLASRTGGVALKKTDE